MNQIIISLTTIHSRIEKVHHVIESLLAQETNFSFKVCLFISEEPYLLDEGVKSPPQALLSLQSENPESFSINYTENIGPYRKFLPILRDYFADKLEFEYLVTVDDDTVYPPYWLNGLIEGSLKYNCVVAYRGRVLSCDENNIHSYKKWSHSSTSVLEPNIKFKVHKCMDGLQVRMVLFISQSIFIPT